MDFGTLIGLLAGVGIIAIGVLRGGGDLYWFFSLNSVPMDLCVIAISFSTERNFVCRDLMLF